jgi:hypothetical protein
VCLVLLQGETTRTLPKPHLSSNHWAFVTGGSVGSLPAGSQQAAAGMLERLLLGLDQQLQEKPGSLPQLLVVCCSDNTMLRKHVPCLLVAHTACPAEGSSQLL